MPYKSKNRESQENEGNPTGPGQSKAGVKTTGGPENIKKNLDNAEKYTQDPDEPNQDAKTHPNRNTHKPGIDNNKYN